MNVLVLDIGGTHIKFRTQRHAKAVKIKSGQEMTPGKMMEAISDCTRGWTFDRVSIGYPGPVVHNMPLLEPHNLGKGWIKFKFQQAFGGKPVRILNDAAMQALGSYKGGRMLFLGLGTGLGSAMIVEGVVQAMELAHMPWKGSRTYEDALGAAAIKKDGRKKWLKHVAQVTEELQSALEAEYVVLGGGNVKLIPKLPKNAFKGNNDNAFKGGFMLWQKLARGSGDKTVKA